MREHVGTQKNPWTRREREVNAGTLAWTFEIAREHGVNKPGTFAIDLEQAGIICNKPKTLRDHLQFAVNMAWTK